MYRYDTYDQQLVDARVAEFRDQVERRLRHDITEDQFKPLRLMNGLYLQLHAYMLRVAIPYGTLSGDADAHAGTHRAAPMTAIMRHFTTRQNIQYNWIKLEQCSRPAGGPRQGRDACLSDQRQLHPQHQFGPVCRQPRRTKSPIRAPMPNCCANGRRLHPEFSFLPRKFKIAVTAQRYRPRRGQAARHRPATASARMAKPPATLVSASMSVAAWVARRSIAPGDPRVHPGAASISATARRSCAFTTATAAATTSTRRASRSSSTSSAPKSSRARSKPNGRWSSRSALDAPQGRI